MATMFQTWTLFTVVAVLTVQLCIGEKSCTIWSSAGPVVQRGSSFKVYCTFNCKCKGSMYSDHPPTLQSHTKFNSTTTYFNVVNITKNRTYSCQCPCPPALDPCGLDISAGYLPERPKNISCIYKVKNNERGVVLCTWNRGRDTFLRNSSVLRVRTVRRNHTAGPVQYKVSSQETHFLSASFTVSSSVQLISVCVRAQNPLGSAESITIDYTLSDIAMPSTPVLGQPKCSSRECIIKVEQSMRTQHLEIQHRAETQTWTSSPESGVQVSLEHVRSSLEPYTLYHFRVRSKFSTGLWSQWSATVSCRTQEDAPAKELDVWYADPTPNFKSLRIYWKEPNITIARGKITAYKVRVNSQTSGLLFITNISANARNYSVPFCADCEVTVWACNSKGSSPPATIAIHTTKVMVAQFKPSQDVQVAANNHSVTISWRNRDTALLQAVYVVEWYPKGHKLEELSWVRLGRNDNHTVVTDIKPYECYEGIVHVFYNESSVSRTRFTGVTTLESAPAAGPSAQETVEGNKVKVDWTEIPRGQHGGCVTNYTIYLENDSGHQQAYSVPASERMYIIRDLSPAVYSLRMTASTAKGEGPAGQTVKFFIRQETPLPPLLVCAVVAAVLVMCLVCLYQSSAVKERVWVYFQCLMLDDIPDPANSKWAKECTHEKGKMDLQLQLNNSTVTEEEEEPILADVEEVPRQNNDICTPKSTSSQLSPQTSLSPQKQPATLLYPLTTYIKSFSHDSDSSNHTHTSLDTTVDYISSHEPGNMYEEDQEEEEEEEEELAEIMSFFPSHNIFAEPLEFGGKLTLNAVKIDCSDFLQDSLC